MLIAEATPRGTEFSGIAAPFLLYYYYLYKSSPSRHTMVCAQKIAQVGRRKCCLADAVYVLIAPPPSNMAAATCTESSARPNLPQ